MRTKFDESRVNQDIARDLADFPGFLQERVGRKRFRFSSRRSGAREREELASKVEEKQPLRPYKKR